MQTRFLKAGLFSSLLVLTVSLCSTAKNTEPVKKIAPDLVVESFEGGKFPAHHAPGDAPAKIIFQPTNVSSGKDYTYGYRIKLKTTRKEINVKEQFEAFPAKSGGRMEKPVEGYIYRAWDDAEMTVPRYWVKVWINDVELPTLNVVRK